MMSETIKITYQVEYFCDDILKDMLASGEYGLGGHPITDDSFVHNALDRFTVMSDGIPMIPASFDQTGILTVEDDKGKILFQYPGYNKTAEREDDHDTRTYE